MGKKTKIIILSLIIIVAAILGFFILTEGSSEIVGENSLGTVTKVNYTHTDNATVSNGTVTGVSAGTAVITASITVSGTTYTDRCVVTVTDGE